MDESYYRTLYDLSPDIILTVDSLHRVIDVNRRGQEMLGDDTGAIQGESLVDLLDQPSGAALTGLLSSGFVGVGESHVHLRDGCRVNFSVARLDSNNTIVVFRDVTQGYLLAAKLEDARRLSSAGRMAGALAQEIINPLSVIYGRIEVLQAMRQVKPADLKRQLAIMGDHCERIAGLVRNLQTLAVPASLVRQWFPVAELIDEAVEVSGRRLNRVRMEIDKGPQEVRCFVDRKLIVQLLVSLLCFAADHSASNTTITLTVEQLEDEGLRICIRDQSMPFTDELLSELERGLSQTTIQPGFGLGLAVASAIARDHGGSLSLARGTGMGNRYLVELPGVNSELRDTNTVECRILRVLVVDDDALLCETVTWMLAMDGHQITDVRSAEEALVRLQTENFDIVIVDMRLPQMSGLELLDAMERQWPEQATRTLLTSGLREKLDRQGYPYLQKPFTRQDLIDAIDQVLSIASSSEVGL